MIYKLLKREYTKMTKTYKIRKHRGRLLYAPVVTEVNLKSACEKANAECYGFHPNYEVYEYTDNKLSNVYQIRVVKPQFFARVGLQTLMKQLKI